MTDAELVQLSLAGNDSAFESLAVRWSPRVLAYARGLVPCRATAEDITQETLLRAYRNLPTLEQPEKFGPWLLCITHRLVLDWRKAKARTEVSLPEEHSVCAGSHLAVAGDPDLTPQERYEQRELQLQLHRLIDHLPAELRQVLLIYYYDHVTYDELARMLGVSKATVNARLSKARALLRARLTEIRSDP